MAIVVSVLILVVAICVIKFRNRTDVNPNIVEFKKVMKHGALQDPNEIFRVMKGVANEDSPEIIEKLHEFSDSKNTLIKAGLALALSGKKDEKSIQIQEKLARDSDVFVRAQVILAAHQKPSVDQVGPMKIILANPDITEAERVQAEGVLYRSLLQTSPSEAKPHLNVLLDWAEASEWNERAGFAVMELSQIMPVNETLLRLNRKMAEQNKHINFKISAIRTLVNAKDPSAGAEISSWIHSSDHLVKEIALESLPKVCPSKRWEWIEEGYRNEKNPSSRAHWLGVAEKLQEPESQKFFLSALKAAQASGDAAMVKEVNEVWVRSKGSSRVAPCIKN